MFKILISMYIICITIIYIYYHINEENKVINIQKSSDYQIYCGNDTLILKDSDDIIKKIPYSDSSDIWRVIIEDNR